MARKRRRIQAGYCYHVMIRGNGGQNIFMDDADRSRFCLLIQYASEKHGLNIHGFCLMGNHVHFIIQPTSTDLSSGMHCIAFRYAQYFNKKYKRRGYLYQGRYKAVLVQSGTYLRRLVRYVHLNPVRAQMVQRPDEYYWSSHQAFMGSRFFTWLNTSLVLEAFGEEVRDARQRLHKYTLMDDVEAREEVVEIRKSFRKGVYGDDEFLEEWCPLVNGDDVWAEQSIDNVDDVPLKSIVDFVCCRLDTNLEDIRSKKRVKKLVEARALMAELTKRLNAGSMSELGRYIFRDPTSLAKLSRKNEGNLQIQATVDESIELLRQGVVSKSYA